MERDAELMLRLRRGQENALEELYRRYSPQVYALLLRMLSSREEAEEILQDTFVQLYRKASQYSPERGGVTAFLFTIARNLALSRLRNRKARPQKVESQDIHDPDQELGFWREDDPEARVVLQKALAQLEAGDRLLLEDAFYAGFSHAELAERHRMPLGTVKTRIRRAILKLRELLAQVSEEA